VFNEIIRRASSFSVAAITTVQTRGSTFAFIPRFRPIQGAQWEGSPAALQAVQRVRGRLRRERRQEHQGRRQPERQRELQRSLPAGQEQQVHRGEQRRRHRRRKLLRLDNTQAWNADASTGWPYAGAPTAAWSPPRRCGEAEQELETRVAGFVAGAADDRLIYTVAPNGSGTYDPR